MIHDLLLRLDQALPFYPPAVAGLAAALVIVLTMWLFKRSRGAVLFSIAVGVLGLGLAVGLFGIDRPSSPLAWGAVEDVADRLIGPAAFRRYEQITAASLVLALGLLSLVYHLVHLGINTPVVRQPGPCPCRST